MPTMTETAVKAAIAAIESETATITEKLEMLLEMAMGLQKKPKDPEQLHQAIALYQHAIDLSEPDYPFFWARAMAGMATALRTIPTEDVEVLLQAKALYEKALPMLQEHASPEEVAEAEMNLGLVLQSLVPAGHARLADSIQSYQRALRVFTGDAYPQEYAILQNNIAIAYLSMPLTGTDIQQGMAVQTFEQALRWIALIDHPSEYAMLQNNLGNALQYLPSTHPVENNWRAIAAYDEALKVRTVRDTPLEYANTIANKANALSNLPDDPEHPEVGNPQHLQQALHYYQEARDIFNQYGYAGQVEMVTQAIEEIEQELGIRG
jgi:tetratricopeptide (TPR) repeat protein